MQTKPVVSVVIGTYNRLDYLKPTIETVRKELDKAGYEIIVTDGGSDDGTVNWLVEQKDIISIIQHNRGEWLGKKIDRKSWGYFMNLGFRAASGKYICMLSDDCLVVPGAIKNGTALFDKKLKSGARIGGVAFYWRNWPEQEKYWVGLTWGGKMFVNHGLYLREALQAIGFADEDNYFFYHADGDISLRMSEAGYETVESPKSFIEHYSDANTQLRASNMEQQKKDWAVYSKSWSRLGSPDKDWIETVHSDKDHTADKYWRQPEGLIERYKK